MLTHIRLHTVNWSQLILLEAFEGTKPLLFLWCETESPQGELVPSQVQARGIWMQDIGWVIHRYLFSHMCEYPAWRACTALDDILVKKNGKCSNIVMTSYNSSV